MCMQIFGVYVYVSISESMKLYDTIRSFKQKFIFNFQKKIQLPYIPCVHGSDKNTTIIHLILRWSPINSMKQLKRITFGTMDEKLAKIYTIIWLWL